MTEGSVRQLDQNSRAKPLPGSGSGPLAHASRSMMPTTGPAPTRRSTTRSPTAGGWLAARAVSAATGLAPRLDGVECSARRDGTSPAGRDSSISSRSRRDGTRHSAKPRALVFIRRHSKSGSVSTLLLQCKTLLHSRGIYPGSTDCLVNRDNEAEARAASGNRRLHSLLVSGDRRAPRTPSAARGQPGSSAQPGLPDRGGCVAGGSESRATPGVRASALAPGHARTRPLTPPAAAAAASRAHRSRRTVPISCPVRT